jgi:hypothetical protein
MTATSREETTVSETTYELTVPVTVKVTVKDGPVGDMTMHPLDPRRMEGIYDLDSPEAMLNHLAYNAVMNGKECASGLDGWGDVYVATGVEGFDDWPRWQQRAYVNDHHPVRMQVVDVEEADWVTPRPPDGV